MVSKLNINEHHNITEFSERFSISANTIYNWRSKYFKHSETDFTGHGNIANAEEEKKDCMTNKGVKKSPA